jgi:hypothetical protein
MSSNKAKEALIILCIIMMFVGFLVIWLLSAYRMFGR